MTNRPNRGWRILGNTARAVTNRSQEPLDITMSPTTQADGNQVLTLRDGPPQENTADTAKTVATCRLAQGKGRASTIAEMAATLSAHEVAAMLGVHEETAARRSSQ